MIDSVVSILQPLCELTDFLAAEKRISVSAVKPLMLRICGNKLVFNDDDTDVAKDMKVTIKFDLM